MRQKYITRRSIVRTSMSGLLVFVMCAFVFAQSDPLQTARQLIRDRRYDDAIVLLLRTSEQGVMNAEVANQLARAYHWKLDFGQAKRWYVEASRLDPKYRLDIVPLLEELEDWRAIIELAEPEFATGSKRLDLLSALYVAYSKVGRSSDSDRVLGRVIDSPASDYRNYILAYVASLAGDTDKALSYLAQIKSPSMRAYARTDRKFANVAGNKRFEELTR